MSLENDSPHRGVSDSSGPDARLMSTVSVVITAYNYGRYLGEALDSVLGQDYPVDRVESIVIDDGSTDDTALVAQRYVERYPGRVRLISQENRGYVGAVNRGIEEAGGELLALLDADDAWMPGKLRRQVEMLESDPKLGLVFGDLIAVDDHGNPFQRPSILTPMVTRHPVPRRAAARILFNNEVLESTILMRRELASPVPEELPIADWWLTLQAAMESEIDWIREPIVRYRIHGENMSTGQHLGTGQAQRPSVYLRDIRWKLRALRMIDLTRFSASDLTYVWAGFEDTALQAMLASATPYVEFIDDAELDPERSLELQAEAEQAARRGEHLLETRLLFESLMWDPYVPGMRVRLHEAAARAQEVALVREQVGAQAGLVGSAPLDGARPVVILVDAEDLLSGDEMLSAYAGAMEGLEVATLAIDATRLAPEVAQERLAALVDRCGVGDREDIDMLAVVGERDEGERRRMLDAVSAYYRRESGAALSGDGVAVPEFSPATVSGLRVFVERERPKAATAEPVSKLAG